MWTVVTIPAMDLNMHHSKYNTGVTSRCNISRAFPGLGALSSVNADGSSANPFGDMFGNGLGALGRRDDETMSVRSQDDTASMSSFGLA